MSDIHHPAGQPDQPSPAPGPQGQQPFQGQPFPPQGPPPLGQPFPPQGVPYPAQRAYGYYPARPWNALCIIGFILAFQFPPAGLILCIIALVQINRTGEQSRGMSIAGIVIGGINTFLMILFLIIVIAAIVSGVQYNNTFVDCGYGSEVCYDPNYDEYEDWDLQSASDPLASIPLLSDTQK